MPEICFGSDFGSMQRAVTNAFILALDWLGSGPEACDALQMAEDRREG